MDPVTATSALGLVTIGGFLKECLKSALTKATVGGAQSASQKLIEIIRGNLREGNLPANHDLQNAIDHSLAEAAKAFACAVGATIEPKLPWIQAIRAHYDAQTLGSIPLAQMRASPERDWVEEIIKQAGRQHSGGSLSGEFLLEEGLVAELLLKDAIAEIRARVDEAFGIWLERHIQRGQTPACAERFLVDGWPLEPGGVKTVTFYQAFCAFFREKLKTDTKVERIYLAETVSRLSHSVAELTAIPAPTKEDFQDWMREELGDLKGWLAEQFTLLHGRHDRLDESIAATPGRVADEIMRRHLIRPTCETIIDISRILRRVPAELVGRDDDLKRLHAAWSTNSSLPIGSQSSPRRPHILLVTALGGEGKTSLIAKWVSELAAQDGLGCEAAFAWSFSPGETGEPSVDTPARFLTEAIIFFGNDDDKTFAAGPAPTIEKGARLARIVGQRRSLLILDGLENLQGAPTDPAPGDLKDHGVAALLYGLAQNNRGLCLITSRRSLPALNAFRETVAPEMKLSLPGRPDSPRIAILCARSQVREVLNQKLQYSADITLSDGMKFRTGAFEVRSINPSKPGYVVRLLIHDQPDALTRIKEYFKPDLLFVIGTGVVRSGRFAAGDFAVASEIIPYEFGPLRLKLGEPILPSRPTLLKLIEVFALHSPEGQPTSPTGPGPKLQITSLITGTPEFLDDAITLGWALRKKVKPGVLVDVDGHAQIWSKVDPALRGLNLVGIVDQVVEEPSTQEARRVGANFFSSEQCVELLINTMKEIGTGFVRPINEGRVNITVTVEASSDRVAELLQRLSASINDPSIKLMELRAGSVILDLNVGSESAALGGVLWKNGLLQEMLGAPIKSLLGAPQRTGAFFFDEMLDVIALMTSNNQKDAEFASKRAVDIAERLPGWGAPVRHIVGIQEVRLAGGRRVTQAELDEKIARHREWLKKHRRQEPGSSPASFYHDDLSGLEFSRADLRYARFSYCRLSAANFSKCRLEEASFTGAKPLNADFRGAALARADFSDADVSSSNFMGADLRRSVWWEAKVEECVFSGCRLDNASFKEAKLLKADFRGASLTEAIFRNADISCSHFMGADLRWAIFREAEVEECDFSGARLKLINLIDADFSNATIAPSELARARLDPVFTGTELIRISLNFVGGFVMGMILGLGGVTLVGLLFYWISSRFPVLKAWLEQPEIDAAIAWILLVSAIVTGFFVGIDMARTNAKEKRRERGLEAR